MASLGITLVFYLLKQTKNRTNDQVLFYNHLALGYTMIWFWNWVE
jgi:hypothetical protein